MGGMERFIQIREKKITLSGVLRIPKSPQGVVLFAHGSGSSHLSPRNNFVANVLHKGNIATLLIDLLSSEEDQTYATRFNIPLLTERLSMVIQHLEFFPETKDLSIGLFGASTGAAAALQVASFMKTKIQAVVSRGGRPDLAMKVLSKVIAPTLLIVGGNDSDVITLNQMAYEELICLKEFIIIPNATHLFEEPGCLETVALVSKKWFSIHLKPHMQQN